LVAIVDDDADIREALCDLLLVLGLRCRAFDRAEALLADYQPGVFDCVIADLRMPGIGGLELLQRLRGFDETAPVIIITSDRDPATRLRALGGGARAFLTKPIADNVLLAHLEAALARADFPEGGKPQGPPDG
jgi:FixJ family two-component response regulator